MHEPEPFRPLRGLAFWTCIALGVDLFLLAGRGLSAWVQSRAASLAEFEDAATSEAFGRASRMLLRFQGLYFFGFVLCAVLFLCWFHRAHRNLSSFRTPPFEYTDGAAVWGFVVPIVSLVYPYWVMQEVWKGSDPSVPRDERAPFEVLASRLARVWWAGYVSSGVVGWVRRFPIQGPAGLARVRTLAFSTMVESALGVVAGVLCIALVLAITKRQELCAGLPATTRPSST
ncbi:MAG: DUF4328 domain-containing protein [Acidobacteriota bacterium]